MNTQTMKPPTKWTTRRDEKQGRLHEVAPLLNGIVLPTEEIVEALEALVERRDRIVMEGDNQKQADFLSRSLIQVDSDKIHDLHLIISSISRPKHLGLFELGIAKKWTSRLPDHRVFGFRNCSRTESSKIGAIHTYVELYARLLVDLIPNVMLLCAEQADQESGSCKSGGCAITPGVTADGNGSKASFGTRSTRRSLEQSHTSPALSGTSWLQERS